MKTIFKITLSTTIFLLAFSCKKESTGNLQTSLSSDVNDEAVSETGCVKKWSGQYANEINGNDTIKQKYFIHNGIAQLPPISWSNYHTGITYAIPSCHTVYGDNVIFEARVKNPNNEAGSVYGYNVALQIQGTNNFFEVYFSADQAGQSYDHIWIGSTQVSNLPELVHYFGDYETVSVALKSNKLWIYINGSLVKSLDFLSYNNPGKIRSIGLGFKGTGSVDWVKLYNRKTSALLMQEDFNIDGQSSVMWYD